MSLRDECARIRSYAMHAAGQPDDHWNSRFNFEITVHGYWLIPVSIDLADHIRENEPADLPVLAPEPHNAAWQYPFPCVVAPPGWTPADDN